MGGGELGAFRFDQNAEIDEIQERGVRSEDGVSFESAAEGLEARVGDVTAGALEGAEQAPTAELLNCFTNDGAADIESFAEFFFGCLLYTSDAADE